MRRRAHTYMIIVLALVLAGCFPRKKEVKWDVTLKADDKNPYGTYLAFQSLQYYFPGVQVETLPSGFRFHNLYNKMKASFYAGRSLLILEGMYFYLSDLEWDELKQYIENGNDVLIFCSRLDSKIEAEMNCYKAGSGNEVSRFYTAKDDFDNKGQLSLAGKPGKYGYTGRYLGGFFAITDTGSNESVPVADTLGFAGNHPDFVRYRMGAGSLLLHAAPLALSNYFLLQEGNENYLAGVLQALPSNPNHIYWNDFYLREANTSSSDILWRHPATRYALILAIVAVLVYLLFESKRKQRIVPVIPRLKNESVSFVETVGRLYYNKGNHANLAAKMSQQFLEWVRAHYFLNTSQLNESFVKQLSIKSGHAELSVREAVEMIGEVKAGTAKVDDAYLYKLYATIQQFYK